MAVARWRAAAFTALLLAGCGPHRGLTLAPPPYWIDNEERPDGLGATGLAQANPQGDLALQRVQAVTDARARLTAKVKARARDLGARLRPLILCPGPDGTLQPVAPEPMRHFTEGLLQALGAMPLEGIAVSAFWEDPVDHTLYVFATLSRASVTSALAAAVQAQWPRLALPGGPAPTLAPGALADAIAAANP